MKLCCMKLVKEQSECKKRVKTWPFLHSTIVVIELDSTIGVINE